MKKIFFACFIIGCFSCVSTEKMNTPKCNIDYEFRANFLNCISIIVLHESGYCIEEKTKSKAYEVLSVLTEVEFYDEILYYQLPKKDSVMNSYLDIWHNWYEVNKCTYSQEDALKKFYQKTLERRDRVASAYIDKEEFMESEEFKQFFEKHLIEFPDFFPKRLKIEPYVVDNHTEN